MPDNLLSKNNAKKLAHRIKSYWYSRGYEIETHLEESNIGWEIRSDMINGFPVKKVSKK